MLIKQRLDGYQVQGRKRKASTTKIKYASMKSANTKMKMQVWKMEIILKDGECKYENRKLQS